MTELEPVMFPIAESASDDSLAAVIEAKVSGREVPKATKVMAVTDSLMPREQPRIVATSPTMAVTKPIQERAMKKAG